MPRRLFTKLRRQYGGNDNKNTVEVHAQRDVLAQVGRLARANQEGTQALFQAYYGGRRVACRQVGSGVYHPLNKEQRPYVVVVGAGLAGLACAYELVTSKQFNVVLVEGNSRVGGRVWSVEQGAFDNTITSSVHDYKTVERGGELVGLNHFLWLHYADEFDLHLDYLEPPVLEESEVSQEALIGGQLLYEYMKLIFLEMDEEAEKLDIFADDNKSLKPWEAKDAKRLDGISLEAYLNGVLAKYKSVTLEEAKKKGFTLNEFKFEDFEKAMAATKSDFENNNGLPCSEQSLFFNLVTIGNGNRHLDPVLLESIYDQIPGIQQAEKARKLSFWEDAELFRCREGNMALAVKFYEHILKEGGQVLLNTTVTEIVTKENHVKVLTKNAKGVVEKLKIPDTKISKVVLAMPPPVWKQIKISPPLPSVTPAMGYLVKYLFDVPPSVTEAFRKCDNSTHTQWGMVWEAAWNVIPEGADVTTKNTLALFAGGKHAHIISALDPKARREYIVNNLNKMRPPGMEFTFTVDSILQDVFMDWPKQHLVETGYSCPTLNECVTLGPVIHSPINGKIYLAGEYACRYKWCGFMEGALISGAGAAKEILKGVKKVAAKPSYSRPIRMRPQACQHLGHHH